MTSLRARLLAGLVVWTIVFVAITNLVIWGLMRHRASGLVIHYGALTVGVLGVLVAALLHLRSVLAPFRRLRRELAAVHSGDSPRVEGTYPTEVAPLVADLNALLDHRARLVERAIAKAADLAHGLKTPLAVLAQEAERLAAAGQTETAATVSREVERLRRQIDVHLAHARAAASGATLGTRCPVHESAAGLARTLTRLYTEKGVTITLAVPSDLRVRAEREDLDEMLGNLLDNACKWARAEIALSAHAGPQSVALLVDDDGPGIPAELRERVLQRGVRADEAAPGSGLGLAIVRDLAELYGGSIQLEASPQGGTRARLTLPA